MNGMAKEYQDAVRALERAEAAYREVPSAATRAALSAAKELADAKESAWREASKKALLRACPKMAPARPEDPYDVVRRRLREMREELRRLRDEGRELRARVMVVVARKRELSQRVIPELQRQKKAALAARVEARP